MDESRRHRTPVRRPRARRARPLVSRPSHPYLTPHGTPYPLSTYLLVPCAFGLCQSNVHPNGEPIQRAERRERTSWGMPGRVRNELSVCLSALFTGTIGASRRTESARHLFYGRPRRGGAASARSAVCVRPALAVDCRRRRICCEATRCRATIFPPLAACGVQRLVVFSGFVIASVSACTCTCCPIGTCVEAFDACISDRVADAGA